MNKKTSLKSLVVYEPNKSPSEIRDGEQASLWSNSRGFRHLFYYSPIGMGLVDLSNRWLAINPALSSLLGVSESDVRASKIKVHFLPEEWCVLKKQLPKLLSGEKVELKVTLSVILANQHRMRMSLHLSLLRSSAGEALHYLLQFIPGSDSVSSSGRKDMDTEERHPDTPSVKLRRHKSLMLYRGGRVQYKPRSAPHVKRSKINTSLSEGAAESGKLYRKLVEEAHIGVYMYQKDKLIYVNPRFAEMFGYSRSELLGRDWKDLLQPNDHPHWIGCGEEEAVHYQCRGKKNGGALIELEGHGACIMHRGSPALIGTVADITERKKTEELLRKSEKLSVAGQLAAGVAHEIRNPLTSLKGFLQLMQNKKSENPMYLDIMQSELDKINFIVNEFLLLAKPQSVQFRQKHLYPMLWEAIDQLESQAVLNKVRLVTEIAPDLPPIHCEADQLIQAFVNIIKNGIEAMPSGGTLEISAWMNRPDRVAIRFKDQGSGIPVERLAKLGEPYYLTWEKGTGFGLMMSYKIIEAHNGMVDIRSVIDKGTVVDVILPIKA